MKKLYLFAEKTGPKIARKQVSNFDPLASSKGASDVDKEQDKAKTAAGKR